MTFQWNTCLSVKGCRRHSWEWSSQMRFKGSTRRKSHQRKSCNLARYPGWSGLSLNEYIARVKVADKAPDSSAGVPSVGNVDLSEVQRPEGIKEIHLLLFDETVEGCSCRWI
ncbi:unnamed protein product [Ectocarpus sp. 12 AP-2014]